MKYLKTTVAAAAVASMATGAFAETCYPVGLLNFTNEDGVSTTVTALVDVPHEKGTQEAKNSSINAHMALLLGNHDLRGEFGQNAQISASTIYAGRDGICITKETRDSIVQNQHQIDGTGITFQGRTDSIRILTPNGNG